MNFCNVKWFFNVNLMPQVLSNYSQYFFLFFGMMRKRNRNFLYHRHLQSWSTLWPCFEWKVFLAWSFNWDLIVKFWWDKYWRIWWLDIHMTVIDSTKVTFMDDVDLMSIYFIIFTRSLAIPSIHETTLIT